MKRLALIALILFAAPQLAAQAIKSKTSTTTPSTPTFSWGAALPASCTVGSIFFLTSATAGLNLYGCTGPTTWSLECGSGSGGGGAVPPPPLSWSTLTQSQWASLTQAEWTALTN